MLSYNAFSKSGCVGRVELRLREIAEIGRIVGLVKSQLSRLGSARDDQRDVVSAPKCGTSTRTDSVDRFDGKPVRIVRIDRERIESGLPRDDPSLVVCARRRAPGFGSLPPDVPAAVQLVHHHVAARLLWAMVAGWMIVPAAYGRVCRPLASGTAARSGSRCSPGSEPGPATMLFQPGPATSRCVERRTEQARRPAVIAQRISPRVDDFQQSVAVGVATSAPLRSPRRAARCRKRRFASGSNRASGAFGQCHVRLLSVTVCRDRRSGGQLPVDCSLQMSVRAAKVKLSAELGEVTCQRPRNLCCFATEAADSAVWGSTLA